MRWANARHAEVTVFENRHLGLSWFIKSLDQGKVREYLRQSLDRKLRTGKWGGPANGWVACPRACAHGWRAGACPCIRGVCGNSFHIVVSFFFSLLGSLEGPASRPTGPDR